MASPGYSVSVDKEYLKSRDGILRIAEGVVSLCGIISESLGEFCGGWGLYNFYRFVTINTLILSIGIFATHYLGLAKHVTFINCFMSVFINDVIFSILYLVATIMMSTTIGICSLGVGARIVACIFGAAGTFIVGLLALSGYQAMQKGRNSSSQVPDVVKQKPPNSGEV